VSTEAAVAARARTPGATTFALMFALESLTRASLATVVPLQALALLGNSRDVSLAFFAASTTGLIGGFFVPVLIRRIGRGAVYATGAALLILAPALLATLTVTGQITGMLARLLGAACLQVALSLLIMEFIPRRELVRSEPRRFLFAAGAWTLGPTLGVVLYTRLGPNAALGLSAFCGVLVLLNFLRLRIGRREESTALPPPNPLRSIRRFVAQPRLLLGWVIAFARSCWWGTFMVYLPIFLVRSDVAAETAALFVSAASAILFLTPLWGRLAGRFGLRRVIVTSFALSAAATLAGFALSGAPLVAASLLLVGASGATALDAVGNIPSFRAVHAYERPQMMAVFRSYVDIADLGAAALYSVLLTFLPLPAVFLALGLGMIGAAVLSRHLPRGM
jgi:MFS family permease